MSTLIEKFQQLCDAHGTTPYYVALDVGISTSLMSGWMNGTRKFKSETMIRFLTKIAQSSLIETDFAVLSSWWVTDLISSDSAPDGTGCEGAEYMESHSRSPREIFKTLVAVRGAEKMFELFQEALRRREEGQE